VSFRLDNRLTFLILAESHSEKVLCFSDLFW
jgi:hypothetical protein